MPDPAEQNLIQRMLTKAMALLDRPANRLARKYAEPSEWKAMESLPVAGDEFVDDVLMWDKYRKYDNVEKNMFDMGIPDTRPDVWPTPMNDITQRRWEAYQEKMKGQGMTERQAAERVYELTSKPGYPGGPVAVIPPNYKVIEKRDLHPKDPFRGGNVFETPFAKDPKNPSTRALVRQNLGLPRKAHRKPR